MFVWKSRVAPSPFPRFVNEESIALHSVHHRMARHVLPTFKSSHASNLDTVSAAEASVALPSPFSRQCFSAQFLFPFYLLFLLLQAFLFAS